MTLSRRMTVTVAVACVLASTALYPLFKSSQWFYAGTGAVIAVAISGALSRLRTLPVVACLSISVLGLLLYLNMAFEPHYSLLRVIPTPTSFTRLLELAGTGLSDANKYAPPAQDVPSLVLIAAGGIGLTAVMADLIAVRLRSAALAGLPLLVLFTVPVTMRAPTGVGTIIVFCLGTAGYLAMLSADGRERIRVWGRLVSLWRYGQDDAKPGGAGASRVPWAGEADPGPDTRAMAAAGRRVGLASVVLALCVPLIVPGLHPSKLFSSGPGIGGTGGPAPALALSGTLSQTLEEAQENHPKKVLTYTITPTDADPQYLQQVVYDNLTDSGWQASGFESGATEATTLQSAQGLLDGPAYPQVTITVNVDDAAALTGPSAPTFLPVPYPPIRIITPPGIWLNNPELMVFSQAYSVSVANYTVTSYQVDPSIAQLNAAAPPPSSLAPDVELPLSYKDDVVLKQIADRVTKGKTTEYAKVDALATWLRSKFSYSTAASGFDSAPGLVTFLTTSKSGVCVQFAYAMTVLARLLGIPARIAGGFTEGTPTSAGHYVVKSNDAHAWPEVYFSGFGWIQFEPTPAGGDGTAQSPSYQTRTPGTSLGSGGSKVFPSQPSPGPATHNTRIGIPGHLALPGNGGASISSTSGGSAGTPWGAIALAVIAAIAIACGLMAIVAPPAHRAMSAHHAEGGRRRRPVSPATAGLVAAVAAILGLTLYRLVSHSSGLDLRAVWATVGIAFGAACAAVLVAPSLIRVGLRRWRWMVARDDASRAHTAWHEFRNDLADFGVGGRPSEPPRTLADRVTAGLPQRAGDAIRRLALAEERATYAARPLAAVNLRRDGTAARRGLAASVRRGTRWRARIFPASVLTTLADGVAAIPDHLAALLSRRWLARRSAS
jgi:transglutaminase-like putative cysteine protease